MKRKSTHVGNLIFAYDRPRIEPDARLFLILNPPETEQEKKRSRRRVGCDLWNFPGGGFEPGDKSQKNAARRELAQETGWKVPSGDLHRIAVLEGYVGTHRRTTWNDAVWKWTVHVYETIIPKDEVHECHCEKGCKGQWFPARQLPFKKMIPSDELWVPQLVESQNLRIRLMFKEIGKELIKSEFIPVAF